MLAATTGACRLARATSDRWPACSAPIVGTRASRSCFARSARQSAMVLTMTKVGERYGVAGKNQKGWGGPRSGRGWLGAVQVAQHLRDRQPSDGVDEIWRDF